LFVVSKRTKRKNRIKFFALKVFRALLHAFCPEKFQPCQANTPVSRATLDGWPVTSITYSEPIIVTPPRPRDVEPQYNLFCIDDDRRRRLFFGVQSDFAEPLTSQWTFPGDVRFHCAVRSDVRQCIFLLIHLSGFDKGAYYLQVLFV